jgi:hypothetical protein
MSPEPLTETERRVLGHLPAWRDADGWAAVEKAMAEKDEARAAEILEFVASDDHPETEVPAQIFDPYPRNYTITELADRLGRDPYSRDHDLAVSSSTEGVDLRRGEEERIALILNDLRERGLVSVSGSKWSMLKAGLEALTA